MIDAENTLDAQVGPKCDECRCTNPAAANIACYTHLGMSCHLIFILTSAQSVTCVLNNRHFVKGTSRLAPSRSNLRNKCKKRALHCKKRDNVIGEQNTSALEVPGRVLIKPNPV